MPGIAFFDKLFITCVKNIIIIINEKFTSFQLSGLNCGLNKLKALKLKNQFVKVKI